MLSFLFSQPGAPGAVSKDYGTAHAHSQPGGRLSSTTPATQDSSFSPQGRDGTAYHRSCRSFFPHHARRIVRGAVIADATSIHAGICCAKMRAASRRAAA